MDGLAYTVPGQDLSQAVSAGNGLPFYSFTTGTQSTATMTGVEDDSPAYIDSTSETPDAADWAMENLCMPMKTVVDAGTAPVYSPPNC